MSKKLKITESQYNRLLNLLTETQFDVMVNKSIKTGDIVKVSWGGKVNRFKVINNVTGEIVMDGLDSGDTDYRYLLHPTSLNGDVMEVRRVNKVNEKDKLNNFKLWTRLKVKGVTNVEVIRGNKVIDELDNTPTNNEPSDEFIDNVNESLKLILDKLKANNGLKIELINSSLFFCCYNENNNNFTLELNSNQPNADLDKWDTFILEIKGSVDDNLFELNKDKIQISNNGETFNLKLNAISSTNKSKIWISNIKFVNILPSCKNIEPDNEETDVQDEEETKELGKEALEIILNNKEIQQAFFKQPTFWQAFVAELKGEKAPGTGIITAFTIASKAKDNILDKKIGEGFSKKVGDIVKIRPEQPINIPYKTREGGAKLFTLTNEKPFDIRVGLDNRETGLVLQMNLIDDPNYVLRIIVDEMTSVESVKLCRLTIGKITKSTGDYTAITTPITKELEFLSSEGYTPPKNI